MTNNIIENPNLSLLIDGVGVIAALLLAWIASALLYLFSMTGNFHNDVPFWRVCQNRIGLLNAKITSYCLSPYLPCLPASRRDRQADQQFALHNLSRSGITAENQNSVIHFTNNHIKLFYSYYASFKSPKITLKNHPIVVK